MTDEVKNTTVSFWDSDDVKTFEGEGGGKGMIALVKIVFGYKVFLAGGTNEDTFFEFDVADTKSREEARKKAGKYASSMAVKPPTAAIAFIARKKETYLYNTENWSGDRWWVMPTWTRGYEEVLKPSLKAADVVLGEQWIRVGFKADPYKPTRKSINQLTGEESVRANLIPFVMEKFENKQAAILAATQEAGAAPAKAGEGKSDTPYLADAPKSTHDLPEGWDESNWIYAIEDIKSLKEGGMSPIEIAKQYDVQVRFVMSALKG